MDEDTPQDEYPIELVRHVRMALTTKHKRGCTGQMTIEPDGEGVVCSSCGPVEVSTITVVE